MSTSTIMHANQFGEIYKLSLDTSAVIIRAAQANQQQYLRLVGGNSTAHSITINDGTTDYAPIYVAVGADLVFVFSSGRGQAITIKADGAGPFNYNAFITFNPNNLMFVS